MKKQKKQFIILLSILLCVIIGYFNLRYCNTLEQNKELIAEDVIAIIALDYEDVVKMSYQYEDMEMAFEKEDDNWVYSLDPSLEITQYYITYMVSEAANLYAIDRIEGVTDMSQYGLTDPSNTICIETINESNIIYIGDYNEVTGVYYVCKPSDTTVYTISSSLLSSVDYGLEDLVMIEE